MQHHTPPGTSSYVLKLSVTCLVMALLSAIAVVVYVGGASGSSVQIGAAPEADRDGATTPTLLVSEPEADVPDSAITTAPAPTLVDGTADEVTASGDRTEAAPADPAEPSGDQELNEGESADHAGSAGSTTDNDVEAAPVVCPEGTTPVAAGCAVIDCVDGLIWNGTECESICHGDTAWNGTECQPISIHCVDGLVWNGSECVADPTNCPEGTFPVGESCAYVHCDSGYIYDGTDCVSICEEGTEWTGNACTAPEQEPEPECPAGTVPVFEGCAIVDCAAGLLFDGTDCVTPSFECSPPGVPTELGCSSPDCGDGWTLAAGACERICDGGVLRNGECVPVFCEGGATWNGTRCIAPGPACPHGQVLQNGNCIDLGFGNAPGPELELQPELINPDLDLFQAVPVLPQFDS